MKWIRLGFAIIMAMGCITSFMAVDYNRAIFFAIACGITVWSMSWGGKNGSQKA